jgi:hypothetical protein
VNLRGGRREPLCCSLSCDADRPHSGGFSVPGIAKGFFASQLDDTLGEIKLAPAILFYLL